MSNPSVRPVSVASLALAAGVGALLGVLVKAAFEASLGGAPAPVGTGFLLLGLAGLVGAVARVAQQRVRVGRERIRPSLAVRWLGIARAALLGGAGLLAFFGLWTLTSLGAWGTPLGRSRTLWSGLAVLGALVLLASGRWLENGLRVPPREEDEASPTT